MGRAGCCRDGSRRRQYLQLSRQDPKKEKDHLHQYMEMFLKSGNPATVVFRPIVLEDAVRETR
jgi:hypothetical protein